MFLFSPHGGHYVSLLVSPLFFVVFLWTAFFLPTKKAVLPIGFRKALQLPLYFALVCPHVVSGGSPSAFPPLHFACLSDAPNHSYQIVLGGVMGLKKFKGAPVVVVPVFFTLLTWFYTHYQVRRLPPFSGTCTRHTPTPTPTPTPTHPPTHTHTQSRTHTRSTSSHSQSASTPSGTRGVHFHLRVCPLPPLHIPHSLNVLSTPIRSLWNSHPTPIRGAVFHLCSSVHFHLRSPPPADARPCLGWYTVHGL